MRLWYNNVVDTQRQLIEVDGDRITIGRDDSNDVILRSPYVASQALVMDRNGTAWDVIVRGDNSVRVGETMYQTGEHFEVRSRCQIELFPFTVAMELPSEESLTEKQHRAALHRRAGQLIEQTHRELLTRMDLRGGIDRQQQHDEISLLTMERHIETISLSHESLDASKSDPDDVDSLQSHLADLAVRDAMLLSLGCQTVTDQNRAHANSTDVDGIIDDDSKWTHMATAVSQREQELDSTVAYLRGVVLAGDGSVRPDSVDRDHVFVERNGVLEDSGRRFVSDEMVESIIQRIVGKVGRRIDQSQPMVDARLRDGSRVNAVIAPLAVSGPTLTIRKFPDRRILIHDLVALGALSQKSADLLRALVRSRRNIVVSGGTGTGKTTLLNCLSDFIPDGQRIVTIEDTAELQLTKQHVVRMETKNANVEGAGEYTIRDLVRNALRMRPDRIVVGECRGPESLDMLQAMNTGHDGSLTTIHANDAHDVSLRLEVLVQMAADLPVAAIREQIGSAIDVIVQLKRHRDGRRIVSQITQCVGVDDVTGQLVLRDLFVCDAHDDQLRPTGQLPTFIDALLSDGDVDLNSFF